MTENKSLRVFSVVFGRAKLDLSNKLRLLSQLGSLFLKSQIKMHLAKDGD